MMKILLEQTDDAHWLSLPQLVQRLASYGIETERKSLYDDLEQLRQFGLDIEFIAGRGGGYCVPNRMFQLAELKLLVDSVQASKFITSKKSMELIQKLEKLTSVYQAGQLQRQVVVTGRVKAMNESVYYNVDRIHAAIGENRQIRFLYFEYTVEKERRFRHNGEWYEISPFALVWENENYYLIGFDKKSGVLQTLPGGQNDRYPTVGPAKGRAAAGAKAGFGRLFHQGVFHVRRNRGTGPAAVSRPAGGAWCWTGSAKT